MRHFFIVLSFLVAGPVGAAETPWQDHADMLRTRLVSTSGDYKGEDGSVMLAWEAKLAPGWKTYWRSPGEAGLPVKVFQNDEALDVLYPLPERFELFGLETYGYSNAVMLPFRAAPAEAGTLKLTASFMVCKDICVPFDATYELPEAAGLEEFSPHDVRVDAWLKRGPDRAGDGGGDLEITNVKLTGIPGRQRLVVDARAAGQLDHADMFAEVNDMVHFGTPETRLLGDGRSKRFVLMAMTGSKKEDLLGQKARLTFTDGNGHAIERWITITR
ncbi:MAG: hypothetical protein HWE25_01400 [Alphaproteobacteria bacterium]|nr:hypothetical protein [Alphaproteobacteria bacterium]